MSSSFDFPKGIVLLENPGATKHDNNSRRRTTIHTSEGKPPDLPAIMADKPMPSSFDNDKYAAATPPSARRPPKQGRPGSRTMSLNAGNTKRPDRRRSGASCEKSHWFRSVRLSRPLPPSPPPYLPPRRPPRQPRFTTPKREREHQRRERTRKRTRERDSTQPTSPPTHTIELTVPPRPQAPS